MIKNKLKSSFVISGKVSKFPGKGGWFYITFPKKYTKILKEKRIAWGMYPIFAIVNNISWKTKLMMKKGGDFFIAFNKEVREKEKIFKDKTIKIKFSLIQK